MIKLKRHDYCVFELVDMDGDSYIFDIRKLVAICLTNGSNVYINNNSLYIPKDLISDDDKKLLIVNLDNSFNVIIPQ